MTAFSPVPTQSLTRVAVLIDGDHIPASFRSTICAEAGRLGEVISVHLFCDLSLRPDWTTETGLDVLHCKGRPGKNCADMALCIAALDMAYRNLARVFVIASNDRDFEPLIRHLQRNGFGARQLKYAPAPAQPIKREATPKKDTVTIKPPEPDNGSLVSMVMACIRENGGDKGLPIADLNLLWKTLGFKISETTEKSWRAWLKARPQYFTCDAKGPDARVRIAS